MQQAKRKSGSEKEVQSLAPCPISDRNTFENPTKTIFIGFDSVLGMSKRSCTDSSTQS